MYFCFGGKFVMWLFEFRKSFYIACFEAEKSSVGFIVKRNLGPPTKQPNWGN